MHALGILRKMFTEQDGRRGPPRITLCSTPVRPSVSLTPNRVVYGVVAAVLAAALGVGHVSLRFAVNDQKLAHRSLQTQSRALYQRLTVLELENEMLCGPDQLREYAVKQLGMVESGEDSMMAPASTLAVVPRTQPSDKAAQRMHDDLSARSESGVDGNQSPMERVTDALLNVRPAMAGALEAAKENKKTKPKL